MPRIQLSCLQQIVEDHVILRSEVLQTGEAGVNLPVNLKRLIWNAQQLFKVKPNSKSPSGVDLSAPGSRLLAAVFLVASCIDSLWASGHENADTELNELHHCRAGPAGGGGEGAGAVPEAGRRQGQPAQDVLHRPTVTAPANVDSDDALHRAHHM